MKQIALVMADDSWIDAPFGDPAWEIWAHVCMSVRFQDYDLKADRWFDPHRPEVWHAEKSWNSDYLHWLATIQAPVYMQAVSGEVPTSVAYPFVAIRSAFPGAPFAGTLDWMCALAVYEGAKVIAFHGADYPTLHERIYQRFGTAYWIGYARGCGIDVRLPDECQMLANIVPGEYGPDFPPWPDGHHPDDWEELDMESLCAE